MEELQTTENQIKNLIEFSPQSTNLVDQLTHSLAIPRDTLPDSEQITHALQELPRELNLIPMEYRNIFIAKAVLAVSVGLFDGAIVYVWNCVIKELREKVKSFGVPMIQAVLNKKHDSDFLNNITDSSLIELAYQLNIITDQGHLFLNQCREIRNQASVAHPSDMKLNDRELITFINRCCEYGLSNARTISGVELPTVINVIENESVTEENMQHLASQIHDTFELQKDFYIQLLYSKFIDPSEQSQIRNNSLKLAKFLINDFSDSIKSNLLTRHNEIMVKGDSEKKSAANSRKFFLELGMVNIFNDSEKIALFNKAINNLKDAHNGFNNFYTEPAFAENLESVSRQITPAPEVVIEPFVEVLWDCYLGNAWGYSEMAVSEYEKMLKNLTPKGIEVLLQKLNSVATKKASTIKWKSDHIRKIIEYYTQSTMTNPTQQATLAKIKKDLSLN